MLIGDRVCPSEKLITNSNAQVGDVLLLTKPIGTGLIPICPGADLAEEEEINRVAAMATLNKEASAAMIQVGVSAATDITGFTVGPCQELAWPVRWH